MRPVCLAILLLVPLLAATACATEPWISRCDTTADCDKNEVCIWNQDHGECLPGCDPDGRCPARYSCDDCLTSAECPICRVCVEACVPDLGWP